MEHDFKEFESFDNNGVLQDIDEVRQIVFMLADILKTVMSVPGIRIQLNTDTALVLADLYVNALASTKPVSEADAIRLAHEFVGNPRWIAEAQIKLYGFAENNVRQTRRKAELPESIEQFLKDVQQ